MKKKLGPKIILITFCVVLCLSWMFWFVLEKYVDTTNYENREMAEFPSLSLKNYSAFSSDFESWFNDNIPFRNNLITLNSAIDYYIFDKSSSDSVIKGKDGWLFYNKVADGDPMSCYYGTNLFSEDDLKQIADNCIKQRDFLEQQGKEFVVMIAPNKERIYSEYMPEQYGSPAEEYRALQVYNYLKENTDIRVVYPYDELMRAKKVGDIYFKTDTHWNEIGGYVGASVLLSELGIEMPDILSDEITIEKTANTAGDLAKLLNLTNQLKSTDWNYSIGGYDNHQMEVIEQDFFNVYAYKAINADSRKLYMIRDSFGSNISWYVGSQFNESYMRHYQTYTYDDLSSQDPDIVVYEVVERYVNRLGEFSIEDN
jgi:hypothetical protein